MQDFFGREISVNDYFFYAIRSGNMADVKVGKVIDVQDNRIVLLRNRHKVKSFLHHTENGMIIPEEIALISEPCLKDF